MEAARAVLACIHFMFGELLSALFSFKLMCDVKSQTSIKQSFTVACSHQSVGAVVKDIAAGLEGREFDSLFVQIRPRVTNGSSLLRRFLGVGLSRR